MRRDFKGLGLLSLSARRAWIEIEAPTKQADKHAVALRKESVDRNSIASASLTAYTMVALRKESVDRNSTGAASLTAYTMTVALRKESVDRNNIRNAASARPSVALRKESVDRNRKINTIGIKKVEVALRKESVDRNMPSHWMMSRTGGRSPQGERG